MPNKWDDRPYAIGKGKPPVEHQFGNGQPTNRGGRRKGSKNIDTIFGEALDEKVTLNQDGKRSQITKRAAGILHLVNRYAQGDLAALKVVLEMDRERQARVGPGVDEPLAEADRRFLHELAASIGKDGGDA